MTVSSALLISGHEEMHCQDLSIAWSCPAPLCNMIAHAELSISSADRWVFHMMQLSINIDGIIHGWPDFRKCCGVKEVMSLTSGLSFLSNSSV